MLSVPTIHMNTKRYREIVAVHHCGPQYIHICIEVCSTGSCVLYLPVMNNWCNRKLPEIYVVDVLIVWPELAALCSFNKITLFYFF